MAYEPIDSVPSDDYWLGMKHGIWLFAWWKDGTQFVGSCGFTLKAALEDVERLRLENALKYSRGTYKVSKAE